ncbi:Conserved_hypothetical protein [Hexamita inflata]|uniref:Uncharacterized protein n=1 Tax=Hexamita inflata TaxID=28002 RepID=A0AA86PT89_9EUKA|nr:Conserved hypothetical protein [Hexamita inflata]
MDIVDISSDSNTKTINTLSEYIHQKYTDQKLKTMKILNITGQKFSSIQGITQYQQITTLNLQNNAISDINALKNMRQIINLDLSSNLIYNIWPLIYLHELQQVNLESNKVKDILAFFGHKKLVSLNLNYNDIINLDPLQDCVQLQDLSLMENNIIDFYILCDMKKLDSVELDGNMLIGAAFYAREYESEKMRMEKTRKRTKKNIIMEGNMMNTMTENLVNSNSAIKTLRVKLTKDSTIGSVKLQTTVLNNQSTTIKCIT